MMKKVKLPINIYNYQADSRKQTLKQIGVFLFPALLADFYALTIYNNYSEGLIILLYLLIIKMVLLIPYIYVSKYLYKSYLYHAFSMQIISVPSILLIFLIFFKTFGIIISLIIFFIFLGFIYLIYIKFVDTSHINYNKAAKNLIDKYPEDLIILAYPFFHGSEVKEKRKKEVKKNSIIMSMLSYVPIWMMFSFSIIIAVLPFVYFNQNTTTHIFLFLLLAILGLLSIAGIISTKKHKLLFKIAQEMIDEEENRRNCR